MNQKLSDWASIAEIVSGVAVVVTLVFLVLGIRDNTEATQAATYEGILDSLNDWRVWIASDDELRKSWQAYTEDRYEELDADQQYLIAWAQAVVWFIYEKTYLADQYGQLGGSEWERTAQVVCSNFDRMQETGIYAFIPPTTREFSQYVTESCESD